MERIKGTEHHRGHKGNKVPHPVATEHAQNYVNFIGDCSLSADLN